MLPPEHRDRIHVDFDDPAWRPMRGCFCPSSWLIIWDCESWWRAALTSERDRVGRMREISC